MWLPCPLRYLAEVADWFAVWTRSRHEKTVRDQLQGLDLEVFLPLVPQWRRWKDRRKLVEFALFPGYCFARFEPVPAARLSVLKCSGVVQIVSVDGEPASIPEHEIQGIKTLLDSHLSFDPCPFIKEGDRVEVVHGPLKGVLGRLLEKGAHAQLILSVELLSRAVRVTVDAADVRALR